jgi:hypothetical protein
LQGGAGDLKTFHFLYMEIIQVERRKLCKWKLAGAPLWQLFKKQKDFLTGPSLEIDLG